MKSYFAFNRMLAPSDDGWIHLVPGGEYPGSVMEGEKSRVIEQVIDAEALNRIMSDYEIKARDPLWTGILVDIEHFSHDLSRRSEAAGWIKTLQRRDDGIWGKPEWTDLGSELIAAGRYKHLSPVLLMEKMSGNRMRAVALSDVGLTNKPLLKTLVPISNRDRNMEEAQMEKLRKILSLPAESTEDQLVERVQQALNRAGEADALKTRAETAEQERDALKTEALNRDAAAFVEKHKDRISDPEKVKALFVANREAAEQMISLLKDSTQTQSRVLNRGDGQPPAGSPGGEDPDAVLNRRRDQLDFVEQVRVRNRLPSTASAWPLAQAMKPELFRD